MGGLATPTFLLILIWLSMAMLRISAFNVLITTQSPVLGRPCLHHNLGCGLSKTWSSQRPFCLFFLPYNAWLKAKHHISGSFETLGLHLKQQPNSILARFGHIPHCKSTHTAFSWVLQTWQFLASKNSTLIGFSNGRLYFWPSKKPPPRRSALVHTHIPARRYCGAPRARWGSITSLESKIPRYVPSTQGVFLGGF